MVGKQILFWRIKLTRGRITFLNPGFTALHRIEWYFSNSDINKILGKVEFSFCTVKKKISDIQKRISFFCLNMYQLNALTARNYDKTI